MKLPRHFKAHAAANISATMPPISIAAMNGRQKLFSGSIHSTCRSFKGDVERFALFGNARVFGADKDDASAKSGISGFTMGRSEGRFTEIFLRLFPDAVGSSAPGRGIGASERPAIGSPQL
ncbi:MAG TPA: hypothetical protein PKD26_05765 [Pyrinomonadaceae bacterium]|nr:hypothetical protein [Pyrinomonadaceae bacterium]